MIHYTFCLKVKEDSNNKMASIIYIAKLVLVNFKADEKYMIRCVWSRN